jgi:hypothetical protein
MSQKSCPISFISVDANTVRINACYTALLFGIYLFTMNKLIIFFLILDFSIRLFLNKDYSLMLYVSSKTKNLLKIKDKPVDMAPKRLATYFGLIFFVSIATAQLLNLNAFFYSMSAILLICIFLEIAFEYCLGCEIYHLYKRFI